MDPPGFEPGAPGVQDRCSTRLSYRPIEFALLLYALQMLGKACLVFVIT